MAAGSILSLTSSFLNSTSPPLVVGGCANLTGSQIIIIDNSSFPSPSSSSPSRHVERPILSSPCTNATNLSVKVTSEDKCWSTGGGGGASIRVNQNILIVTYQLDPTSVEGCLVDRSSSSSFLEKGSSAFLSIFLSFLFFRLLL